MWFKKTRLETPFKGDNVKALVKTSNCENLVLYFSEKVQKFAAFAMLFWFSVTKQSFENGVGFPNDQKYPRYPLVLKLNVTLARPLRWVILYFFKLKILSDDRRLYIHYSNWNSIPLCRWADPYKTIAKFTVHSIYCQHIPERNGWVYMDSRCRVKGFAILNIVLIL